MTAFPTDSFQEMADLMRHPRIGVRQCGKSFLTQMVTSCLSVPGPLAVRISDYSGLRIIWSPYALAETQERLFPASRHRSPRIRKKLIHRFGGEFRRVPTIYRFNNWLIAHPALRTKIESALARANVRETAA